MFDLKNYTFGRTSKIDVRPVTSVDVCIDFIGSHLCLTVLSTLAVFEKCLLNNPISNWLKIDVGIESNWH